MIRSDSGYNDITNTTENSDKLIKIYKDANLTFEGPHFSLWAIAVSMCVCVVKKLTTFSRVCIIQWFYGSRGQCICKLIKYVNEDSTYFQHKLDTLYLLSRDH